MRSLHCLGDGAVAVADAPDPRPGPGEALVRIEASAVCGSERGDLLRGRDGNAGHEACGVVVDPGPSRFAAGERVGLSAVAGCGSCDLCRAGEQLYCRQGWRASSGTGWHAELAAVDTSALQRLPDGIDAGLGAMLSGDPLGVPVRGLRRAPSEPGERVVVIGLGPVGLGHLLVRAFTGAEVVAIEPSDYRGELGLRLGAAAVFPPGAPVGAAPRLVIECTGRPDCIALALSLVEPGGTVLQSGECHEDVPVNPSATFIRREVTYTGSWYYAAADYPAMLELYTAGLPLDLLRTHDVPAADAQPAVADFLDGRSGKVVLRWS